MLELLQTYSGVLFFAAFFVLMLRMHAGHRGRAGHESDHPRKMPEPARIPAEDGPQQSIKNPDARRTDGCH